MPNDIFHSAGGGQTLEGSFDAGSTSLTIFGGPAMGMLIQNLNWNYTQQITRLYEIGSPSVYYVGGRAQGQLTIAQVVGPAPLSVAWIKTFGDICKAKDNTMNFEVELDCNDAGSGSKLDVEMTGCVITTVAGSVAAQDVVINQNVQITFAALDYK